MAIDGRKKWQYYFGMDIASLSTGLSQGNTKLIVAIEMQKLAMNYVETQGAALLKMMSETIVDPALGNQVNLQA